ncbi:MAG: tRNA (guanosine(46)-N7)-methyltransferase TrmB [Ruminococcaceae bacterium]|nr:tRNA (guanosine(46)-N7)-methyltransferase TrmB [Oscillospiraceae bacterium]
MRMRKKKNLEPRLERCEDVTILNPQEMRSHWREIMPEAEKINLEIGCGKGRFITTLAAQNPQNLYVAIEREKGAIVMAMEKVKTQNLANVRFIVGDAAELLDYFADDEIDDLYVNFCDPWTKRHREKRRLTHRNFLALYRHIMRPTGHFYFKTDNVELFDFSELEIPDYGMKILTITRDLHSTDIPNIMTEYEERFSSQGMKINYIEAMFPQE